MTRSLADIGFGCDPSCLVVVSVDSEPLAFDELGWRLFFDLCAAVLELDGGVRAGAWVTEPGRHWCATVPAGITVAPGAQLDGPCRVDAMWISDRVDLPRSACLPARLSELKGQLSGWAGSVAVISNYAGLFSDKERLRALLGAKDAVLLGPGWLSARVDGSPALRRMMPSLLSLGALERWVSDDVRRACTLDVDAARALGDVFVETGAYRRALAVLDEHRFVVLSGPPEMGKTAIARMIALALMTDGWQAFECTAPSEIFHAFDVEKSQVFVADDAFGSTEYRPDAAELWAREMSRLLEMMDGRHWLIWTSRPAPLRAGLARMHRERGAERFPQPGEVLVDASRLSLDEKVLILLRHAKAKLSPELRPRFRTVGYAIVSHEHFTPERIRRLVATDAAVIAEGGIGQLRRLIERHIQTPTEAMETSFRALSAEHQALLFALLDAPSGPVEERHIAQLARVHHPEGLSRPPMELVDRLTDHFLRVSAGLKVDWVHPSWRDLVIDRLRHDQPARERFLERCTIEGVLLAISTAGGPTGSRTRALIIDDRDWDLVTDRVVRTLSKASDRDAIRLLDALAITEQQNESALSETCALAQAALEAAARHCDRQSRPIEVDLIRAWFALARELPKAPPPPRLDRTWTELLPSDAIDLRDPRDLDQALAWLELIELLDQNDPDRLAGYGFPDHHQERIEAVLGQAKALAAGPRAASDRRQIARLLHLCRRHGDVAPQELPAFDDLLWQLGRAPELDLPTNPFHRDDSSARSHVEQILEDL